jgi:hypothetical protein
MGQVASDQDELGLTSRTATVASILRHALTWAVAWTWTEAISPYRFCPVTPQATPVIAITRTATSTFGVP